MDLKLALPHESKHSSFSFPVTPNRNYYSSWYICMSCLISFLLSFCVLIDPCWIVISVLKVCVLFVLNTSCRIVYVLFVVLLRGILKKKMVDACPPRWCSQPNPASLESMFVDLPPTGLRCRTAFGRNRWTWSLVALYTVSWRSCIWPDAARVWVSMWMHIYKHDGRRLRDCFKSSR